MPTRDRREHRGRWRLVGRILRRLAAATSVGVAAIVGALLAYRPWGWRWHVPFSTHYDNQLNAIFVQNILSGSVYSTDRLGAPFGQHLQDFPVGGDRWTYLLVRLLGQVWHDPFTVLNALFILGFGLTAAVTYLVARELRLRAATSTVVALLTAFLPYHFLHGESHVWLSTYVGPPLAVLLAVWVLRDELRLPLLHRRRGTWSPLEKRRLAIAVVAAVIIGGTSGYYAAFAVLTIAAMGVLGQARRRSWRALVTGVVVAAAVAAVLLANLAPELIWRARYGTDLAVAHRTFAENDAYALRLSRLVIPDPLHHVGFLGSLGRRTVGGEGDEYAGIFALAGLVIAWWTLLRRSIGSARSTEESHDPLDASGLAMPLAVGVQAAFLLVLGTAGGLGAIGAALGVTQFRAWARVALPLAICGLLALGGFVEQRLPMISRRRWQHLGLAVVVLGVGVFDQVPRAITPDYAAHRAAQEKTRAFVKSMEATLPRDAMVYQFPTVPFPEHGPVWHLQDYDLALPSLLGDGRLRWSYGGVRGREADWQIWWSQQPLDAEVRGIAAAGFTALTVDRRAYRDHGVALVRSLNRLVGPPSGAAGDLVWYDLRLLRAVLEHSSGRAAVESAGQRILHGVVANFAGDVTDDGGIPGHVSRWLGPESRITFANPMPVKRTVLVRMGVDAPAGTRLRIRGADVDRTVVVPASGRWTPSFPLQVPGDGRASVTVEASGTGIPNLGAGFPVRAHLTGLQFDEAAVRAVTERP